MLSEEYGLSPASRSPTKAAAATFVAFVLAGSVPLIPFVLGISQAPTTAAVATGLVFFAIGSIKSYWSLRPWWRSGLETFAIGMGAAMVAYLVGAWVDRLVAA
jgi:VIT1/CCC1 family predicted Fe2+/Mn2+ transporter